MQEGAAPQGAGSRARSRPIGCSRAPRFPPAPQRAAMKPPQPCRSMGSPRPEGAVACACSSGAAFPRGGRGGGRQPVQAAPMGKLAPGPALHLHLAQHPLQREPSPCAHRPHRPRVRTSACLKSVPVPAHRATGGTPMPWSYRDLHLRPLALPGHCEDLGSRKAMHSTGTAPCFARQGSSVLNHTRDGLGAPSPHHLT